MRIAILFSILFSLQLEIRAQDSLLNYFLINKTDSGIYLNWEMKGGSTCDGIEIQRSTDSVHFSAIGFIPGICGNNSSPVSFEYLDENPIGNSYNYYRLKLGLIEESNVVFAFYAQIDTDGYYIYPNPTNDESQLFFKNKNLNNATISIMDISGRIIQSESVKNDNYTIKLGDYPTGMYIFSIELANQIIIGKIIKK